MQYSPGFYLEYLRGRSFPPQKKKNAQLPHKKYCLISLPYTVYVTTVYRKNHPDSTRSVHTALYHFSKLCLKIMQNAPDCFSAHIHFKKCPGGTPPTPLGRSGPRPLLPEMTNPR